MDPGVRGPRWHQLTFLARASSHLKLAGLLLRRPGREWKWRGGTHPVHLDPVPSLNRDSPSTLKQRGAKIPQGQERGTGIPKHGESLGTFNG